MRKPTPPRRAPTSSRRRPRVLGAVVAMSLAAWVVLVSAGTTPEVDATAAQHTIAALDSLINGNDSSTGARVR